MEKATDTKAGRLAKEDWRRYTEEWETSKEPQKIFCERRGLSYTSFIYWRMKFSKENSPKPAKQFARIQVPTSTTSPNTPIKLSLPNGIVAIIANGTSKELMEDIFEVLGVKLC